MRLTFRLPNIAGKDTYPLHIVLRVLKPNIVGWYI